MKNSFIFIFIVALLISAVGILSIYSSVSQKEGKIWQDIYKRQIVWALLGVALFIAMSKVNYRRLWDWTYILYVFAVLLLFLVFVLGIVRLGAQRWLKLPWFNLQPSEFAKLIIVIFLARYFSSKSASDIYLPARKFGIFRSLILPFIFVLIPVGLIIEQPDLGSAILIGFLFMAMLFLSGIKLRYFFGLFLVTVLAVPVFWHFLRDYQRERLLVFVNPNIDPLGAGYTIIQSKIAIGSGGIFGKGWLSGTQSQLHFLPESHTDFVFATFAEEWGFAGCIVLLFLYFALTREALLIAQRTQDPFGRLLAFGISLLLAVQVFVNIAMNLGLAPVVGVPLPLMSYGGSSLLVTFLSLGILANIGKTRGAF